MDLFIIFAETKYMSMATGTDSNKVVHVHLKEAKDGKQDYYFGSLKAIYDILEVNDIGRSYSSLISVSIEKNGGFLETRKCTIRIADLVRTKRKDAKED